MIYFNKHEEKEYLQAKPGSLPPEIGETNPDFPCNPPPKPDPPKK